MALGIGGVRPHSPSLSIGVDVQAWDVNLDQIAALAVTDNNIIVGNGAAWVAESGATARTSLGLGSIATQAASAVAITGGTIAGLTGLAIRSTGAAFDLTLATDSVLTAGRTLTIRPGDAARILTITADSSIGGTAYVVGGTDVAVADGGTGLSSGISGGILGYTATGTLASSAALTANALLLGGGAGATPSALGSLGTTTTVLHGNAAGAPTFSAVSLTADVSGILPTANGGTGIAFFTAAGPTIARIYTFPDAATTILTTNAAVTVAQGGTGAATLTGIVIGAGTAALIGLALAASQSIRRNAGDTAYEAFTPTAGTVTSVTGTAPVASSGGATPAISITGAAGQVLAGAGPAFTATPTLGASGTPGSLAMGNATSGTITLQPVTGALGTVTVSLPAATDTLMGKATTDTFTNKTFDTAGVGNSLLINGVAATANTGTGSVVRATSPTLVAPALGTPTALVLTSATGLPVAGGGTGVATLGDAGVLIGNGTGAVQVTGAGTSGQVLTSNGAGVDPTFQAAAGGATGLAVRMSTAFETAARFTTTLVSGGTAAFGSAGASGGVRISTSATATSSAKIAMEYSGNARYENGSPVWSFSVNPSTVGTDFNIGIWIGTITITGSALTLTTSHMGFKLTRAASGTINIYATQADGTTENASASLGTLAGDSVDWQLLVKRNGSTSGDYYTSKQGGAFSAATNLTTNIPGSFGEGLGIGVTNLGVASNTVLDVYQFSYERS